MAGSDQRLEVLEDELKLLKGEVKRTLVDLRAFVMAEDSPLNERVGYTRDAEKERPERMAVMEVSQAPVAPPVAPPVAQDRSSDAERRVDLLEDELKAVRRERPESPNPQQPAVPLVPGHLPPYGMGYPPQTMPGYPMPPQPPQMPSPECPKGTRPSRHANAEFSTTEDGD